MPDNTDRAAADTIRGWAHLIFSDLNLRNACLGLNDERGGIVWPHSDACGALCQRLVGFGGWAQRCAENAGGGSCSVIVDPTNVPQ